MNSVGHRIVLIADLTMITVYLASYVVVAVVVIGAGCIAEGVANVRGKDKS